MWSSRLSGWRLTLSDCLGSSLDHHGCRASGNSHSRGYREESGKPHVSGLSNLAVTFIEMGGNTGRERGCIEEKGDELGFGSADVKSLWWKKKSSDFSLWSLCFFPWKEHSLWHQVETRNVVLWKYCVWGLGEGVYLVSFITRILSSLKP